MRPSPAPPPVDVKHRVDDGPSIPDQVDERRVLKHLAKESYPGPSRELDEKSVPLLGQHSGQDVMEILAGLVGHVAWQEENWALRRVGGAAPIDAQLDALYNTFASEKATRAARLPGRESIMAYVREVRQRTLALARCTDFEGGHKLARHGYRMTRLPFHQVVFLHIGQLLTRKEVLRK